MNLTLILRDVPVKDDAAYKVLYSLCPKRIIYSVDFGIRSFVMNRKKVDDHRSAIEQKVKALSEIVPFNGASEVCPLFPSYWFDDSMDEETRGYAAGEAFRLFAGVKRVYFDLGMKRNYAAADEMAETIWKLQKETETVSIVPLSSMVFSGERSKFAPILSAEYGLEENLKKAHELGCDEVFVIALREDAREFMKITHESPIGSLVFWSALSAKGLDLPVKEKCEETAPADTSKRMRALYTSIIRDRAAMDAEVVGHVGVNDVVKVVHMLKPNVDGTAFGRVDLGERGHGYVIVKHFNQAKFEEIV